mmetsp:Transcript_53912/g.139361  ORF Transcript_53912/g.139361 Transcript_53912/m.139361 type:complete len:87 (-) Transcript_53912:223-483(-)
MATETPPNVVVDVYEPGPGAFISFGFDNLEVEPHVKPLPSSMHEGPTTPYCPGPGALLNLSEGRVDEAMVIAGVLLNLVFSMSTTA